MGTVLLLLLALPGGDFTNVAQKAGLAGVPSGRAVFVDLNGDGKLDVVLDRQHFFLQENDGFHAAKGLPFAPDVVLFADFNGDGKEDCFAGVNQAPEKKGYKDDGRRTTLFLNDGKGGWIARRFPIEPCTVTCACALDYDHDGCLDLFVGCWYRRYGESYEAYPDRLFKGDGKGGFTDVTKAAGLMTKDEPGSHESSKPTYGVTSGDWNNDGWPDLFVCVYGRQWNFLWRNNGDGTFTDVAAKTTFDGDANRSGKYSDAVKAYFKQHYGGIEDEKPFRSNGNTFDCAIGDFDNDGDFDCILAEITHAWAGPSADLTSLLVNLGPKQGFRFARHSDAFPRKRVGEHWNQGDIHCDWIDFDNDGLLDALISSGDYPEGQELRLFRQRPDHTFEPARTFGWVASAGISVGDFDNDGDLDILAGRSLMRLSKATREKLGVSCALFRNDVGNKNHWLQIVCAGKGANRDAIGARVMATTPDGVTQTREIRGGLGVGSHNDPYLVHFGLGHQAKVAKLEIRWPDGKEVSDLKDVAADQRITVHQP